MNLSSLTSDGSAGSRPRQTLRRLERDGGTFRIAPYVPVYLPALRRVARLARR